MAVIRKEGIPNKNTVGALGDTYIDTTTGKEYKLSYITTTISYDGTYKEYEWKSIVNDSIGFIPPEYITEEELEAKDYVTNHELNAKGYLTEHQDISNKADKSEIPTKTSQLINDSNFLSSIPSEYVTDSELNAKGYLTQHQDISNKLNKNLGALNAGKMLVVGADGDIVVIDIPSIGDIIGTVDENNNIILTSNLIDGAYELKYENKDGTYSYVGTLVINTVEPEPKPSVDNLFNLETTQINMKISGTSGSISAQNGCWLTDLIPIDITNANSIYVKNATMKRDDTTNPAPLITFHNESGTLLGHLRCNPSNASYNQYIEVISEGYTKIDLTTGHTLFSDWWSSVKYFRVTGVEDMSGAAITKDSIADVIITLNNEINAGGETPEPVAVNLFDLETTKINTRYSGSGQKESAQNGVWLTDLIPLNIATDHTIYVKNAVMSRNVGTAPSPVVSFFDESGAYLGNIQCNPANSPSYTDYTTVISTNYTKISLTTSHTVNQTWWSNVKYMRIAGVEDESAGVITKDSIADVIIRLNEEIQ